MKYLLVMNLYVAFQRMFGTVQRLARLAPVAARSQLRSNFSTSTMRAGDAWSYRTMPPHTSDKFKKISQGIMTFTWWWIFYGIFTEPAHIFGFWDNYPEPEKWTDAELGIPADDE